jgi:hypothetical protein
MDPPTCFWNGLDGLSAGLEAWNWTSSSSSSSGRGSKLPAFHHPVLSIIYLLKLRV